MMSFTQSYDPAPSSLEEELDNIFDAFKAFVLADENAGLTDEQAKSQLKQLILKDKLKDFLELIGPDESVFGFYGREEAKNQLREKLRQSARKRYQS